MQSLRRLFEPTTTTDERLERRVYNQAPRPPARVERAVREGVAVEHGRGLVQAARVRGLEHVASEALHAAGGLTELEAMYIRRSPLGEARYRAIVDTAAVHLAAIVSDTGRP